MVLRVRILYAIASLYLYVSVRSNGPDSPPPRDYDLPHTHTHTEYLPTLVLCKRGLPYPNNIGYACPGSAVIASSSSSRQPISYMIATAAV
jgi:hypothetical protein